MKIKIKQVIDGWQNFLVKSEVTEAVAETRASICAVCPNLRHGKLLAFIKDDFKEIEGCYCNICTCPTSAMIRSKDKQCSDNPPKW